MRAKRLIAEGRDLANARKSLERSLLVRSAQEHTESGHHVTVLETWDSWAPAPTVEQAAALTMEEASAALEAAGITLTD
jgi:hypothetical protein